MKEEVIRTPEELEQRYFGQPFFAFIDILGFKGLVENNAHEDLGWLYERIVNLTVELYSDYYESESKEKEKKYSQAYKHVELELVNISDSILLWTKNSKPESLYQIVRAVRLLMTIGITIGIPLRGAIVKGDIEVMKKRGNISIIGRGLVDAYGMEGSQLWSGCVIEESIFTFLNSFNDVVLKRGPKIPLIKDEYLVKRYPVPLKDGSSKDYYIINWAKDSNFTEEEITASFEKHNKRLNESEKIKKSIEIKIQNTLEYFRLCK